MRGEIWKIPVNEDGIGWIERRLLVLDLYEALPYNNSYIAARCLILDTGEQYNIYADLLQYGGERVE